MEDEKKQMKQISVKEKGTDLCWISDKKKHIEMVPSFVLNHFLI
ncbi:Uncharacterized protein BM_BM13472 [Brugia malayi]|uniref:Bm13472 n=1 Tax=Brugia malayi TaxID=6279 RepID=A0A0K0IXX7_BRUMA|nr:Uncharacterized protein BM_BM13472 [Brugia malayi]CDP96356.1 Bm13472 [Brugia malayi]VIO98376.1 Uncharacterized protein BM_BM13472 [Brugia malayi]